MTFLVCVSTIGSIIQQSFRNSSPTNPRRESQAISLAKLPTLQAFTTPEKRMIIFLKISLDKITVNKHFTFTH